MTPMFAKGLNYAAPLRIHSVEVEGVERSDHWNECLFEMLKEGKLKLSHNENTLVVSFEVSIINTSMIFNINIIWKDTTVIGVNHLLISWYDL